MLLGLKDWDAGKEEVEHRKCEILDLHGEEGGWKIPSAVTYGDTSHGLENGFKLNLAHLNTM
jgi:hypothetical protein